MSAYEFHVGRSWNGPSATEATCPCPKAPCGLVIQDEATCDEHRLDARKTMRSIHASRRCPAAAAPPGGPEGDAT